MGETLTTLQSGGGRLAWVVAIEAYPRLLTSGPASAAVAAWAASSWTTALSGLRVQMDTEQRIDPWSTDLEPTECMLTMSPDAPDSDTFGTAVHAGGGGVHTYLTVAADCNDTGLQGLNAGAFDASGYIYVGLERMAYSSIVSHEFQITNRGMWAPFSIDGGTDEFGRAHPLPTVDLDVLQRPIISSAPLAWVGRHVGVWLHRMDGDTMCTRAEAQLVFAGTIDSIEDTADGATVVRCVDMCERLMTTTLLYDQFSGPLATGIYLVPGTSIDVRVGALISGTYQILNATAIWIYTGAGAGEIEGGRHEVSELGTLIAEWLNADAQVGSAVWTCYVRDDGHFVLDADNAAWVLCSIALRATTVTLDGLGWEQSDPNSMTYDWVSSPVDEDGATLISPGMSVAGTLIYGDAGTINLDAAQGTWISQATWLPPDIAELGADGVVRVGSELVAVAYVSDVQLTILGRLSLAKYMRSSKVEWRIGDPPPTVSQVVILHGSLLDLVTRLFASTGTSGYNHATYDSLPAQLGAAIPWALLGDGFTDSLQSLAQSSTSGSLTIVLEKPTTLWDAIGADLLLRAAYLVWRGGSFRWATILTPDATDYDHAWTEDDKASAAGPGDAQRTVTRTTSEFLRNVLALRYDRAALGDGDSYLSTIDARFTRSIQEYGQEVAQEIDCRNSYSQYLASGTAVESLAADLIARVLPLFGAPLKVMTRTISPAYYESVAPGDIALITDSHARDPSDGARGMTAKPALVLAVRRSFGGATTADDGAVEDAVGEAEVLFLDRDVSGTYCPTCEVDETYTSGSYTSGIDLGNARFAVHTHKHSESTAAVDSSHFATGDKVMVVEIDPDAPGTVEILYTTIDAIGSIDATHSYIEVANDPSGTVTPGNAFRIYSDDYATAVTSQREHVYLADDADGEIADLAEAYVYASKASYGYTAAATTELGEKLATKDTVEGEAVAVGPHRALAINANNLVSRASAIHVPAMLEAMYATESLDYLLVQCVPIYVGLGGWPAGLHRELTIAPMARSDDAGNTATIRVTVSSKPPTGETTTDIGLVTPYGSLTFSTASTTMAVLTPQSISVLRRATVGIAWVYVEVKNSAAGLEYWGLPDLWLGPLET